MSVPFPAWLSDAADGIRRLADRPWILFLLLLALNAIARPSSPTAHDAHLYSLQAINQAEHGAFADDIFLRYGSQDQYSIFSRIVGPIVATFGVPAAFFALYFTCNALFVYALIRFIRTLVDDSVLATISLIYLVTAPLNYGGGDIFTVHEQFFTPRTIGTTLTLFALEQILRQRLGAACLLLMVGSVFHPLMTFGGMMIWAGCAGFAYLPQRLLGGVVLAGAVAGAVILSFPAIGTSMFGVMDDEWHSIVRVAVGYNYPDTWSAKDWLNVAISFAVPIATCLSLFGNDPRRQQFIWIATYAGAIGFCATVAASFLPYALLFQGQPYRVLWILKVLQIPFGFMLVAHWSQSPNLLPRIIALSLVTFFCVMHYIIAEFLIFLLVVPISLFIGRVREESWWYALARGLVLGAIGWMLYRLADFFIKRHVIAQHYDLDEIVMFELVSPIFVLSAVLLAAYYWQTLPGLNEVRWVALGLAILIPVGLFATEVSPSFREQHTRFGSDVAFVRDFLKDRHDPEGKAPAVYSSLSRTDLIWTDLHATSYFGIMQTAGVMFQRQTAEEIQRRIQLVNKFEMHTQRQSGPFMDDGKRIGMENLLGIPLNSPEPTVVDLIRLCLEPELDFVVIPQEFPGLYSASNGRIFVYECYRVRSLAFSVRVATSSESSSIMRSER